MAACLPPLTAALAGPGRPRRQRDAADRAGHRGRRAVPGAAARPADQPPGLLRQPRDAAAGGARADPAGRRDRPGTPGLRRRWGLPGRHRPVRRGGRGGATAADPAAGPVGLSTYPADIPPLLLPALALAAVTTATKILTGWYAARRAGVGTPGRLRAGGTLVARGEFSIVIAGPAAGTQPLIGPLVTAYVLILVIVGPLAARYAEPEVGPALRALRRAPSASPGVPAGEVRAEPGVPVGSGGSGGSGGGSGCGSGGGNA